MMAIRNRKWIFGLVIAAFAALVVWDIWTERGPADLPGGFEEFAFLRNEQNKGGIVRIYVFYVSDTARADYQGCGDLLPHNEYGSKTKVFFFTKDTPAPNARQLRLEPPHFDTLQFRPVAVYSKGEDGQGRVETDNHIFSLN